MGVLAAKDCSLRIPNLPGPSLGGFLFALARWPVGPNLTARALEGGDCVNADHSKEPDPDQLVYQLIKDDPTKLRPNPRYNHAAASLFFISRW